METCGRCNRAITQKDAGLCLECWKALFEEDQPDSTPSLPSNLIILEPELPF